MKKLFDLIRGLRLQNVAASSQAPPVEDGEEAENDDAGEDEDDNDEDASDEEDTAEDDEELDSPEDEQHAELALAEAFGDEDEEDSQALNGQAGQPSVEQRETLRRAKSKSSLGSGLSYDGKMLTKEEEELADLMREIELREILAYFVFEGRSVKEIIAVPMTL